MLYCYPMKINCMHVLSENPTLRCCWSCSLPEAEYAHLQKYATFDSLLFLAWLMASWERVRETITRILPRWATDLLLIGSSGRLPSTELTALRYVPCYYVKENYSVLKRNVSCHKILRLSTKGDNEGINTNYRLSDINEIITWIFPQNKLRFTARSRLCSSSFTNIS